MYFIVCKADESTKILTFSDVAYITKTCTGCLKACLHGYHSLGGILLKSDALILNINDVRKGMK